MAAKEGNLLKSAQEWNYGYWRIMRRRAKAIDSRRQVGLPVNCDTSRAKLICLQVYGKIITVL